MSAGTSLRYQRERGRARRRCRAGAGGEAAAMAALAPAIAFADLLLLAASATFFCFSFRDADESGWRRRPASNRLCALDGDPGLLFTVISRSFDSAAETKPTGMPTTSAGRTPSSRTRRMISSNAVGALPMPMMAPSRPRRCALRMDCTARVVPRSCASSMTSGSEMYGGWSCRSAGGAGAERLIDHLDIKQFTGVSSLSTAARPARMASAKRKGPLKSVGVGGSCAAPAAIVPL